MQVALSTGSFLLFYGDFLSTFLVNLILLAAAELIALDAEVLSSSAAEEQLGLFVATSPFSTVVAREMRGWFIIPTVKYTHFVVRQLLWKKIGKMRVFPQGNAVNISWGLESHTGFLTKIPQPSARCNS